jgi:hypothetical protein
MNLLPFEKIIYQSKLTQTEITQRLQQETVPLQYIRISFFKKPSGKKFEGKVLENSFNIQRIIYYRNSFLPVISGKVEEEPSGSIIRLEMQLNTFVKVFLIFFLAIASTGFFSAKSFSPANEISIPVMLLSFSMILLFYMIIILTFHYEVKKAKKNLEVLLDLEISNRF